MSELEALLEYEGEGRAYGNKELKMAQVEFDLPRRHVQTMLREFMMLKYGVPLPKRVESYKVPSSEACKFSIHNAQKVSIFKDELSVMKYCCGDDVGVREIVKEACIYLHLKEFQGIKIPSMLAYGVPNYAGYPGFFFIVKYYGEILSEGQVSPSELGDLLQEIHGKGIILGKEFPRVTRYQSRLMLVDMAKASFEKRREKHREEFEYLRSLCKGA